MANVSSVKTGEKESHQNQNQPYIYRDEENRRATSGTEELTASIMERTKKFAADAKEKAQEALTDAPNLIRRYPLQSLAVGVVLGFVIAKSLTFSKQA